MPDPHQPVPFDVALRGYDRDQVDAHLASIESEFSSAVAERDRLAERVKHLESRVEELHLAGDDEPSGSAVTGFGARIERIMRTAEEEATAAREEALADAERDRLTERVKHLETRVEELHLTSEEEPSGSAGVRRTGSPISRMGRTLTGAVCQPRTRRPTSTISSRCTTSRRCSGASSRLDRPSSGGSSPAS